MRDINSCQYAPHLCLVPGTNFVLVAVAAASSAVATDVVSVDAVAPPSASGGGGGGGDGGMHIPLGGAVAAGGAAALLADVVDVDAAPVRGRRGLVGGTRTARERSRRPTSC